MSPLEYLKTMLHQDVLVDGDTTTDPNETIVTLKEKDEKAKSGEISLHLPPNSVVFRLDMTGNRGFEHKSNFFSASTPNIHGGCDYVVLCYYNDKYWFVLIELKSDDTSGAAHQLCCSTVFVRYLRELIFACNKEDVRYELTCLVFSTHSRFAIKPPTNLGKRPRRPFPCHRFNEEKNFPYYGLPYPPPFNLNFNLTTVLDCGSQTDGEQATDLFNRPRCAWDPSPCLT